MQVSKLNGVSFKALLGEKECIYTRGLERDYTKVVQHIYPFKDEFRSKKKQDAAVDTFRHSEYFLNDVANGVILKHDCVNTGNAKFDSAGDVAIFGQFMDCYGEVVVEDTLPFTKKEFLDAKKSPQSENVSKEALKFINSDYQKRFLINDYALAGMGKRTEKQIIIKGIPDTFTEDVK